MAKLAALQVGHHSFLPAQPNKGQPGAGRLGRIYRGMCFPWLGPDRPLTHRLHPAAAQRSAAWRKPKRRETTGFQGLNQASLESDDIFEIANALPGQISQSQQCKISIIPTLLATGFQCLRMASHWRCEAPPSPTGSGDEPGKPHILPSSIPNPHMLLCSSSFRAAAYASAHVTRCIFHRRSAEREYEESFR